MSNDTPLLFVVMGLLALTTYLMVTAPPRTAEERKEMEEDWWE
jgi:hypothetical protein